MVTTAQKLRNLFTVLLCTTLCFNCSEDDDGPDLFIIAMTSTSSFDDLNTCHIDSGALATMFDFTIPYEASDGIAINKVVFDIEWSNGDTGSAESNEFINTGTDVLYNWCYRFATDEWVEITHRLETEQGITSNPSVIRVFKPQSAN